MKTKLLLMLASIGINVNAQTKLVTNYITIPYINVTNETCLPARVSWEVVTNWTTTSVEYPTADWANKAPGFNTFTLEYHASGYHETGIVLSNTIATIKWKEKQIPVVLESVQIGTKYRTTWR